jgi:hypothetical protein
VNPQGTPDAPVYAKQLERPARGTLSTDLYLITVDEGWRGWVLCTGMYEWAADGLLEVLRASGKVWPR